MNTKAKGSNAERELIHMLWKANFAAFRAAGSGSNKYPCPDIIAGNNLRKLAIEVKISGNEYQHLTKEQMEDLKQFSETFGAEPWIAVKFKEWYFLTLEDIKETESNFSISLETAQRKGLSFNDLINF
jgi:holliday junction resolvase Hjr